MYPLINISDSLQIYTFWLCMVIAWLLFFGILHHLVAEKWIQKHPFGNIVIFTLSSFFFARIIYILSEWRNEKFIFVNVVEWWGFLHFLREFFITDTYKLSLAGAIVGFLLVFFILTKRDKNPIEKYMDALVPAFLIMAGIGYFGALLGGQIYGIPFNSVFSIHYTDKNSIVPFQNELFPLPILYSITCMVIYLYLKRLEKTQHPPHGTIGFLGMGIFGVMLFLWEFLNGSTDMLSSVFFISFNQALGFIFILWAFVWMMKIIRK